MKHKYILLFSLLVLSLTSMAQDRYFFYVRYNPLEGNSSAIVDEIDQVVSNRPDQLIVMLSKGSSPLLADMSNWRDLRQSILTQQNAPSLYADIEEAFLDSIFIKYLHEQVRQEDGRLMLFGDNDREWSVNFILSEQMYEQGENDYESIPIEFVKVNQLAERGITVRWLSYNNSDRLTVRPEPQHPFYK